MKLISLNIWGGKEKGALFDFIEEHKDSADIFCFQEVLDSPRLDITESHGARVHIFQELTERLGDFSAHYFPMRKGYDLAGKVDFEISSGKAIFIRSALALLSSGAIVIDEEANFSSSFSYVRLPWHASILTVLSFHGRPLPGNKLDTPERLAQSRRVLEFAKKEKGEVVICGDFNLFPETESIRMLEKDFTNLIKTYNIKTTRSRISPYYGTPEQQNFADYTFVSKGIRVLDFQVPEDCVASDHLPMILEFD